MTYGAVRFVPSSSTPFELATNSPVLADFNGDGLLDMAMAAGNSQVGVALGYGNGKFGPARYFDTAASSAAASGSTTTVIVGDFNNDGKPDLAYARSGSSLPGYPSDFGVLLNTGAGSGSLSFEAAATTPARGLSYSLAVGDFNGDGKLDVAAGFRYGSRPGGVFLGNGDGTFQNGLDLPSADLATIETVAAADFNGDGVVDLAVTFANRRQSLESTIGILLGEGDGTFGTPSLFLAGSAPRALTMGDFNGDGVLDIATANAGSSPTDDFLKSVGVLIGDGRGGFTRRSVLPLSSIPIAVTAADLNGSGKLDLSVLDSDGRLTVLYGKGNGDFVRFGPRQSLFSAGAGASGNIAVGRIANRTLPDLAVLNGSGRVTVLLNHSRFSRPLHRRR
ncbi:FG-GAP repeat domain-containing protein [Paludisphaera rhizosphaerae]|nr:VCBS repeat-containing protein [Paludisphaera rhizosphaerae]